MWMTQYVREVKKRLQSEYGFVPERMIGDEPVFAEGQVPDGEYPMTIEEGRRDMVRVVGGRFQFDINQPPLSAGQLIEQEAKAQLLFIDHPLASYANFKKLAEKHGFYCLQTETGDVWHACGDHGLKMRCLSVARLHDSYVIDVKYPDPPYADSVRDRLKELVADLAPNPLRVSAEDYTRGKA
jgi:hypothetical protein